MNEGKQAILQNPFTEFYANGLIVDHETVKGLMKFLDVYGVEMKQTDGLALKTCVSVGPNYLLHISGYDKIKPYVYVIHGTIDGFRREILGLRVASTNKNPTLVALCYIDWKRQSRLALKAIRTSR